MRRGRPSRLRLLPLLLACGAGHAGAAVGNCRAGGPGYAFAFDGMEGMTVSTEWAADGNYSALTVEYWALPLDPYLTQASVFAYSVLDLRDQQMYEQANELVLLHAYDYFRSFRGTSSVDIAGETQWHEAARAGRWVHVALAWSADPAAAAHGQLALYFNGELVANRTACPVGECDAGRPLHPGGVIHLGQEADVPYGAFDENQAFTGALDELRVWSGARTDAQIARMYQLGVKSAGAVPDAELVLYWKFDDAPLIRGDTTADSSGALPTLDGHVGVLVCPAADVMTYATERPVQLPVAPPLLPSDAPLVGAGPVVVPVLHDVRNEVTLRSYDPDDDALVVTITRLPAFGEIFAETPSSAGEIVQISSAGAAVIDGPRTSDQRVYYVPRGGADTWQADSFAYAASDGGPPVAAEVELVAWALPIPRGKTLELAEDSLVHVALAQPCVTSATKRIANARVVIAQLPEKGALYQACFTPGGDGTYPSMCAAGSENLVEINETGTVLDNVRGLLMYAPDRDDHDIDDEYASVVYYYADPDDASLVSASATLTFHVEPRNDPPVGVSRAVVLDAPPLASHAERTVRVPLNGTDVDYSQSALERIADHEFAMVSSFPEGGVLRQAVDNDHVAPGVEALEVASSWASSIVRFSSQFSKCDSGKCYIWSGAEDTGCNQAYTAATSTCRGDNCTVPFGETLSPWGAGSCANTAFHATQLLGEEDVYPEHRDASGGWDMSHENSGREFIELRFDEPIFVTRVEIYEIFKPGAVVRVSTTANYTDDNTIACCGPDFPPYGACEGHPTCSKETNWTTLWAGDSTGAPANTPRRFVPPLCPALLPTDVLRLDLDTAAAPGWNNFDAVRIEGFKHVPPRLVLPDTSAPAGEENAVDYTALSGIHGVDQFKYTLSDCVSTSEPAVVTMEMPAPRGGLASAPYASTCVPSRDSEDEGSRGWIILDETQGLDATALMDLLVARGAYVELTAIDGLSWLWFMERKWDTVGDHHTFDAVAWQEGYDSGIQFDAVGGIEVDGGHAELWITPPPASGRLAHAGVNTSLTWRVQVHVCPQYSMAYVDTPDVSEWDRCQSCLIGKGGRSTSRIALGAFDSIAYDRLCDGVDPPTEDDGGGVLVIVIEAAIPVIIGVACIVGVGLYYRHVRSKKRGKFLLRETGSPPVLKRASGVKYDLFISHCWASAQDQAALVKRQLTTHLAKPRIFLDVDDMESIDQLETYVEQSTMLIVVLSKGYFLSRNCLREIHAAVKLRKPLALLHEANTKRGGAPLSELYDECPAELRDAVFGPRDAPKEVVTWHRERHLQQVSLLRLADALLKAMRDHGHATETPRPAPTPPRKGKDHAHHKEPKEISVYLRDALTERPIVLTQHAAIFVSPANRRAMGVASELFSAPDAESGRLDPKDVHAPRSSSRKVLTPSATPSATPRATAVAAGQLGEPAEAPAVAPAPGIARLAAPALAPAEAAADEGAAAESAPSTCRGRIHVTEVQLVEREATPRAETPEPSRTASSAEAVEPSYTAFGRARTATGAAALGAANRVAKTKRSVESAVRRRGHHDRVRGLEKITLLDDAESALPSLSVMRSVASSRERQSVLSSSRPTESLGAVPEGDASAPTRHRRFSPTPATAPAAAIVDDMLEKGGEAASAISGAIQESIGAVQGLSSAMSGLGDTVLGTGRRAGTATHMLLLLDDQTFVGDDGDELALHVAAAIEDGVKILLLFQRDEDAGGCEFDRFFYVTPTHLVRAGLYKPLAISLYASRRERDVARALLLQQLESGSAHERWARCRLCLAWMRGGWRRRRHAEQQGAAAKGPTGTRVLKKQSSLAAIEVSSASARASSRDLRRLMSSAGGRTSRVHY